jgi:hypothetical protein
MNSILVIHPYKRDGVWAFDDPAAGLVQEPFVAGADLAIDRMVEGIENAEAGVTLFFSAAPFPGAEYAFRRVREESGGHWYYSQEYDQEGWLCPALFKYFDHAPERLFVQVKPKPLL